MLGKYLHKQIFQRKIWTFATNPSRQATLEDAIVACHLKLVTAASHSNRTSTSSFENIQSSLPAPSKSSASSKSIASASGLLATTTMPNNPASPPVKKLCYSRLAIVLASPHYADFVSAHPASIVSRLSGIPRENVIGCVVDRVGRHEGGRGVSLGYLDLLTSTDGESSDIDPSSSFNWHVFHELSKDLWKTRNKRVGRWHEPTTTTNHITTTNTGLGGMFGGLLKPESLPSSSTSSTTTNLIKAWSDADIHAFQPSHSPCVDEVAAAFEK